MYDTNEDLRFFYPEEGTNIFVDSICIPKNAKNYEAALMYINFLLEPDIATANAEYIGYASPNTAVINNEDYCYYQNEILYPDEAVANLNAANALLEAGLVEQALPFLRKAGDSPEAQNARGVALILQGRYDEAQPLLLEAAEAGLGAAEENARIL